MYSVHSGNLILRTAGSARNTVILTAQILLQRFKTTHSYLFEDSTEGGGKT